jgi:hypothetical protein
VFADASYCMRCSIACVAEAAIRYLEADYAIVESHSCLTLLHRMHSAFVPKRNCFGINFRTMLAASLWHRVQGEIGAS